MQTNHPFVIFQRLLPRFLKYGLVLLMVAAAHAATLQDINDLLKEGQNAEALDALNAYTDANPRDAQGRFLKGVVLMKLQRNDEALAVFGVMTQDYPELPEPYNNMAVIYAQQGQYDKARMALEMALRTHPSYATAYENLGDIYLRLASQSYEKALQFDTATVSAKHKLEQTRQLINPVAEEKTSTKQNDAKPAVNTNEAHDANDKKAAATH
jgi:Flp pilus assembly protein TadD